MSALGEVVGAAGGAVTGGLWKVGAIVLAILLLVTGGGLGFGWWLAAHDRDVARADLKTEQGVSAALRAGINTQNAAIITLGQEKLEAEKRGLAAQQLAAANGRRFDGALAKLEGARAITCAEAMPAVNQLLKDIR
ncbi:hypothetical protein ACEN9F_30675 [Duganella sp. CT11-25]|uniref:hypothetical protein n=1 Tax=unclassified Duganella TaxID=2636909 RepID=UPI0039B054AF